MHSAPTLARGYAVHSGRRPAPRRLAGPQPKAQDELALEAPGEVLWPSGNSPPQVSGIRPLAGRALNNRDHSDYSIESTFSSRQSRKFGS
jgi:hypothetical protein